MGVFDSLYQDAVDRATRITQPTVDAITALDQAAEERAAEQDGALASAQAQILADADAVASLQTKLTTTQQQDQAIIANLRTQLAQSPLWGLQDFHMHSDWKSNVGPSIGSTAPTTYSFKTMQAKDGSPYALLLMAQQAAGIYGDVLISVHRTPAPAAGKLTFAGRFWLDQGAHDGLQALEIDSKVNAGTATLPDGSVGTKQFNFSSHIKSNGMLEISGDSAWKATGVVVGWPAASAWHSFLWEYVFDIAAGTYAFIAFTLDGQRYLIPATAPSGAQLANMVAAASNWSAGIHPQLQFSLNTKGLLANAWFDRLRYAMGGA